MFRESNQIIRIDGEKKFVDVREAFLLGEGKVSFNFRTYDLSKPKGQKTQIKIDFYMDLDEFEYLADEFYTGKIVSKVSQGGYRLYGGCSKDNQVTSRQLVIEGNADKLYLKALQGPGKKGSTGSIMPLYKDNDTNIQKVVIVLSPKDAKMLGQQSRRAIEYYHEWNRTGILEERIKQLQYSKDTGDILPNERIPSNPGRKPALDIEIPSSYDYSCMIPARDYASQQELRF